MVESGAERHPNITRVRDIAFQGRHDEGVLERTNLILYKMFGENIDAWRTSRVEELMKSDIDTEKLTVASGRFSLFISLNAFKALGSEFTNFPHGEVVKLLSNIHASDDILHLYVHEREIGVFNQTRVGGFCFTFKEDRLVTRGVGAYGFQSLDPMEGESLMTKLSAAAEFVDMIDMKLSDFGALTPAKAS